MLKSGNASTRSYEESIMIINNNNILFDLILYHNEYY